MLIPVLLEFSIFPEYPSSPKGNPWGSGVAVCEEWCKNEENLELWNFFLTPFPFEGHNSRANPFFIAALPQVAAPASKGEAFSTQMEPDLGSEIAAQSKRSRLFSSCCTFCVRNNLIFHHCRGGFYWKKYFYSVLFCIFQGSQLFLGIVGEITLFYIIVVGGWFKNTYFYRVLFCVFSQFSAVSGYCVWCCTHRVTPGSNIPSLPFESFYLILK